MAIPNPNKSYEGIVAVHAVKWDIRASKRGGSYLQLTLSDGGYFNIAIEPIIEKVARQIARTLFSPPLTFKTIDLLGAFLVNTGVPLILHREIEEHHDGGFGKDQVSIFWHYKI